MDDAELLRSYAIERSEQAFRELVQRHLNVVHGAALRQVGGDTHLAQDVCQRVFVALAQKARALQDQPLLVGWLYTAARLEAARAVRTETRRRNREEKAHLMNSPLTDCRPDGIEWEQLSPVLDDAMGQLGAPDREAVLLRFFSGKSFAEVGQTLKLTEDAARKRVDRAVEKLRQILRRRGIISTAAAVCAIIGEQAAAAPGPVVLNAVATNAWSELAGGSAAKAGILMSMNKVSATIVGAALLATAGIVIRDAARLRTAVRQETTAELASAQAARQQDDLSRQLAAFNRQFVQHPASPAVPKPAAVSAAIDRSRPYLTDPAYRRLALMSEFAKRHLEFQRLYRKLGLSPDQIQRFENIMALQDQANLDAMVVRDNGGDPQAVYQQSGPEWNSEMRDLIGPDGLNQLQDYLRSMPVRAFVDSLFSQTDSIGAPITLQQADQLAEAALANDAMYQNGKGTDPGTVNWDAVWAPAAQILSPDQLTTLQTMVQNWSLQKRIQQGLSAPRPPTG